MFYSVANRLKEKILKRNNWQKSTYIKKKILANYKLKAISSDKDKEQTFGLCGRRQEWDCMREWHWNMYITLCKIDDQCKFNAWSRAPKAGTLGKPRGMGQGRRWEGGPEWWDTCTPMADSCRCMAKTTTIL